jgi:hypothetical protein
MVGGAGMIVGGGGEALATSPAALIVPGILELLCEGAIGSGTQNSCPGWHVNQSSAESAGQQSPGLRLLSSRNPGLEQP